jgi:4-hydroxy-tetrahydrodipicolinate reductase
VVSAISYYPDRQLQRLRRIAVKTRVLHSPNITLGVNFLIIAAKILQNIAPEADIEIVEEHFSSKLEVSGTAKIIARELSKPESAIKTIRAGGIVGVHEILFGFPHQTVRLKHESIAREAFGNGVLFGIDNLAGKPNGFYTMGELLIPYFKLRDTDADKERISPWWQFWAKRDNRTEPRVLAG